MRLCCHYSTGVPLPRTHTPTAALAAAARTSIRCPHCEAPTENAYHFLFECPFYAAQRTQHPLLFPATCTSPTAWLAQPNTIAMAAFLYSCYQSHRSTLTSVSHYHPHCLMSPAGSVDLKCNQSINH